MIILITFIHISDIHIGASFKGASFSKTFANIRNQELKETFFKTIKYVNDNNINLLFITGDLFDYDYIKHSEIINIFNELNKCSAQVFIIAGNHEPRKQNSFWDGITLNENIHLFDSTLEKFSIDELNIDIYGHSWNQYYYKEDTLKNIKIEDQSKYNILLAHGDIYDKKSEYLPIDKSNLIKQKFDYIGLGHIHKHEFITQNIAYSGSLEPLSFKETGPHGFIKGTLSEYNKFEFIPFSKREFKVIEIKLTGDLTENEIHNLIKNSASLESKQKDMYRIKLTGRYNHQIKLDTHKLQELFQQEFKYLEFIIEATYDFDLDQLKKDNKDNIIGKYISKFEELGLNNKLNKEAFLLGLEELINSKEGY